MNFLNAPTGAIKGVTVNKARRVFVERGFIYDVMTDSWVMGFVIHVGNSTQLAVTVEQADSIVDTLDDMLLNDEYDDAYEEAREAAKRRHPSRFTTTESND